MTDLEKFEEVLEQMKHVYLTAFQSKLASIVDIGEVINRWYDFFDMIYSQYKDYVENDKYLGNDLCDDLDTDASNELEVLTCALTKIIKISRGFNV
jgi:hypothetical protein